MKLSLETLKLNRLFDSLDKSTQVRKNIVGSLIIKGLSVVINIVSVPVTLHYLLPVKYGVWLTLSSIIAWFTFCDIGLGNGLRNRLAEAVARGNIELARIYVSTTYTALIMVILPLMLLFPVVNYFLNWAIILNIPPELASEINLLTFFVFELFFIQFVLQLIVVILIADQKPAISSLMNLCINILSLLLIYILAITTKSSLLLAGTVMAVAPCLVYLFAHIWYYTQEYKQYAPSYQLYKRSHVRDLMGIGVKFFMIQISAIVIYSTTNMLIVQLGSPEDVTNYNIAFKYFYLAIIVLNIVLTPIWSAITDAFYKNDIKWISSVMTKLLRCWVIFVIGVIIMLSVSNRIYEMWIGKEIHIPFALSFIVALCVIANGWNLIFVTFLNGVGKITLQLYLGFISSLAFIPLAILLSRIMISPVIGVVTASLILAIFAAIWTPIQYCKIINNRDKGIWAK
jgi:O-antigen/teichoic acid export membrane protein